MVQQCSVLISYSASPLNPLNVILSADEPEAEQQLLGGVNKTADWSSSRRNRKLLTHVVCHVFRESGSSTVLISYRTVETKQYPIRLTIFARFVDEISWYWTHQPINQLWFITYRSMLTFIIVFPSSTKKCSNVALNPALQ